MQRSRHDSVASQLASVPLFARITPHDRRQLAKTAVVARFSAGEVFFNQDERADRMFMLTAGAVSLTRRSLTGQAMPIGQEIAVRALITPGLFDGGSAHVTATALGNCAALIVPASAFAALCSKYPEIPFSVLAEFSRCMRRATDFIDLLTIGSIRQRVARVLFDLVDESGASALHLPCTQAKLALSIGTVREVVFRHLKQMQSEGVLHFHGSAIVIDDLAALRLAAGAPPGSEHVFGPRATPSIPAYIVHPKSAAGQSSTHAPSVSYRNTAGHS